MIKFSLLFFRIFGTEYSLATHKQKRMCLSAIVCANKELISYNVGRHIFLIDSFTNTITNTIKLHHYITKCVNNFSHKTQNACANKTETCVTL